MNSGLAGQIDSFLQSYGGSPLAGKGSVFVAAGKKYGVDPRLVASIAGAESSFGKNPLGSFNAWGWGPGKPFSSWEEGIATVTKGLAQGYINQGLVTPAQIVSKYAPASDGNNEEHWSGLVGDFMRQMGASPSATAATVKPARTLATASPAQITAPSSPQSLDQVNALIEQYSQPSTLGVRNAIMGNLGDIARWGHASPSLGLSNVLGGALQDQQTNQSNASLVEALQAMRPTAPVASDPTAAVPGKGSGTTPPTPAPPVPVSSGKTTAPIVGKVIGGPYQGTHAKEFNVQGGSDNWESENAVDVSAPEGTPIRAVADGTIGPAFGSLGSGGRFAGLRLHLVTQGDEYYYAHLSKFAPGLGPGSKVTAGEILGYSGSANGVAHLHFAAAKGDPTAFFST